MRQSTIKIVLFALALVFAVSCYKDLSTEASITLSDIEITSELERLDVYYGETLKFTPEVKIKGRKSSDIEYKWEMTIRPQDDNFEIDLGSDKSLEYFVGNSPSSNPYIIRLTVTDKVTGVSRQLKRSVYNDNKTRLLRGPLYQKLGKDPTISFCYSNDPEKELSDEQIITNWSKRQQNVDA